MYRDLKGRHKITLSCKTHCQKDLTLAEQRPLKGEFCSGVWICQRDPVALSKYARKGRLQLVRKKTKVLASHGKINFKICF